MTQQVIDFPDDVQPPAGDPARFDRRWHLTAAGLSNVWLYGDLRLPAPTGRLLLRGPNGTGKTTALEGLCPYLLDLNPQRLGAGKSRTTTLKSLMDTGFSGKRRYGYVWLEFAAPGNTGVRSFGVRLQYSQGGSPAVTVVPFTVLARPLVEFDLHGPNRAPLTAEEFSAAIEGLGGELFEDPDDYITRLGAHVLKMEPDDVRLMAQRMRQVRNPSLLGEVTPREAAESLRESLPGVDPDIIDATAKALSESEATREAFRRDAQAANVLESFAEIWSGHVTAVVRELHDEAAARAREARSAVRALARAEKALTEATAGSRSADDEVEQRRDELADARARVRAAEQHEAYKAAGRLIELQQTAEALADNAALEADRLVSTATSLAESGRRLIAGAQVLDADIGELVQEAVRADSAAGPDHAPFAWRTVPRAVITVGGVTADPGPAVRINVDADGLEILAGTWCDLGRTHRLRANSAGLALKDHESVGAADTAATKAEDEYSAKAYEADKAVSRERSAAETARNAVAALAEEIAGWAASHPDLSANWREGAGELVELEPAAAVETATSWAESIRTEAAEVASRLDARADDAAGRANAVRAEAELLRTKAAGLRAGELLPLPRPDWAGPGNDDIAMGSVLEWRAEITDERTQALVESAMAAAGLLGATLDDSSATTAVWTVSARDSTLVHNGLDRVLAVDPDHPRASAASAVLARIALRPSALTSDAAGVTIGIDGTFRAGVLAGRAPGAAENTDALPASHVGARQRRAAALREAQRLEIEAEELLAEAAKLDALARGYSEQASDVRRRAGSFPKIGPLRAAEADRARLAQNALDAVAIAEAADHVARGLRAQHRAAAVEWAERTRSIGLPPDVARLDRLRQESGRSADVLDAKARELKTKHGGRARALLADARTDDAKAAGLAALSATAKTAHERASEAEAKLEHLQRTVGSSAAQAVHEYDAAQTAETVASARFNQAEAVAKDLAAEAFKANTAHQLAAEREAGLRPAAARASDALRHVLTVDGVAGCLGLLPAGIPDAELLEMVAHALAGRPTNARKTVRERYDQARADLAGIWALEPGDSHGELDTFVLTHQDQTYMPHAAAVRARTLKERAEAALAAAEEAALRDFVVGRLPSAIGVAWQRLQDWKTLVNRKMRTAAASSGVGVQVRVHLLKELSTAAQTVYELSCQTSDAARGLQEQQRVGNALQALISAAPGETMEEKVAAAVDIRDWVSVHYEVERPGQQPTKWGARTGLSGGERRLVVLAPMLAAIAAAYDRSESDGLRLAALDEVPAEVDEEGRTALARYLAQLDLDLLCTSYLWDGAPGAWDGVDAYDLEKDMDGTVVAFPMLVRGLLGDDDEP